MPEPMASRVFVEETSFRPKAIEGLHTGTTAFVGPTLRGPVTGPGEPLALLGGVADFERLYGSENDLPFAAPTPRTHYLAHAVRAYFANGGKRLYVSRVFRPAAEGPPDGRDLPAASSPGAEPDGAAYLAALACVANHADVSIVAAPGSSAYAAAGDVQALLLAHAGAPRAYRVAILDMPPALTPDEARDWVLRLNSTHAAVYYPWLQHPGTPAAQPPSGALCGIYARVARERGVHAAPANQEVYAESSTDGDRGEVRLVADLTAAQRAVLGPAGVNCLRASGDLGIRVWGARTASADTEVRFVQVRRYLDYLCHSLDAGTQWAMCEPNDARLWGLLREAIGKFLFDEWRRGALLGGRPEEAFFVRCDRSTLSQDDIDQGRVVCLVGIALARPAEFVVVRLGQQTATSSSGTAPA